MRDLSHFGSFVPALYLVRHFHTFIFVFVCLFVWLVVYLVGSLADFVNFLSLLLYISRVRAHSRSRARAHTYKHSTSTATSHHTSAIWF